MNELILAIESSCDETSVAVIKNGDTILSNIVASQIKSHQRFGGVVPEVASRHHVEQITLCIEEALTQADTQPEELSAVAVTYGPGLVGALLSLCLGPQLTTDSGQSHGRTYLCSSPSEAIGFSFNGIIGQRWPYRIGVYGRRWLF